MDPETVKETKYIYTSEYSHNDDDDDDDSDDNDNNSNEELRSRPHSTLSGSTIWFTMTLATYTQHTLTRVCI